MNIQNTCAEAAYQNPMPDNIGIYPTYTDTQDK